MLTRSRSGVTLIELLVALAILAVLIAILLPALAAVRTAARDSKSLSNLRSNAQVFSVYTGDNKGLWPHYTVPGADSSTVRGAGMVLSGMAYFHAFDIWHIALADTYYDGVVIGNEAVNPPGFERTDRVWPLASGYHYPCSFIAEPAYWRRETRTGRDQMRATQVSAVLFPSQKALLVESWPFTERVLEPSDNARVALLFAATDASADSASWRERNPGVESGDGMLFQRDGAVHFNDYPPFLHTLDGVRGRDIIAR